MDLAFVLLLSCCCDAPFKVLFNIEQMRRSLPRHRACRGGRVTLLCFSIPIHLKSLQALTVKFFLVCFGLPSTNKKFFTDSLASLAMTKTLRSQRILQICRVFVIARPLYKNTINLNSIRPKQSVLIQQNTN